MKEYNELIKVIKDYEDEVISYRDLMIVVREISYKGLKWVKGLGQDIKG